jgi:uncharacterized protein (TIGR02270 family)
MSDPNDDNEDRTAVIPVMFPDPPTPAPPDAPAQQGDTTERMLPVFRDPPPDATERTTIIPVFRDPKPADTTERTAIIPAFREPPHSPLPEPPEVTAFIPPIFSEPAPTEPPAPSEPPAPAEPPEITAVIPAFFEEPSRGGEAKAEFVPVLALDRPPAPTLAPEPTERPTADELPLALDDAIVWSVIETHLDEAEYLLDLRETSLDAADWTLDELAEGPERRLLAHLDGLVTGDALVATQLLEPALADASQSPSRITVAALARLAQDAQGLACVLDSLDASDPEHVEHHRALTRALVLGDHAELPVLVLDGLASAPAHGLAARLHVLAALRIPLGRPLLDVLQTDQLALLRAAATLARVHVDPASLAALAALADHDDLELRALVLDAALQQRVSGAWSALQHTAAHTPALRRWAFTRIAMLGDAAAQRPLLAALDVPEARADALWALGYGGRTSAIEAALPLLADPELGPLAAELVWAIAGLPLDDDALWLPASDDDDDEPERALPPLADDDLDATLEPAPEAALPRPNPAAITAWWHARREQFDEGPRYLGGRLLDHNAMLAALREGPLRRRPLLALELELRSAGLAWVDTRAWCAQQRARIDAAAGVSVDYQRALVS